MMIDLRNTCVLVRTPEENQKLLKEAEKQGFAWYSRDDCKPLPIQYFPDILKFYNDKSMVHSARIEAENSTFYEASELLGTKEMTARKFAEWIADISNCDEHKCADCALSRANTKRNESLCFTWYWKNNIDELFEIVASGRAIVLSPQRESN